MRIPFLKNQLWLLILPLATLPVCSYAVDDPLLSLCSEITCSSQEKSVEEIANQALQAVAEKMKTTVAQNDSDIPKEPTIPAVDSTTPPNSVTTPIPISSTPSNNPTTEPSPSSKPVEPTTTPTTLPATVPTQPLPTVISETTTPASQPTLPNVQPVSGTAPSTNPDKEPISTPIVTTNVPTETSPSVPTVPASQTEVKPTPEKPAFTPSPIVTDDATCPQTSTITVSCTAGNQLFKNITVAEGVSVSQIRLQGQITNHGLISNGVLEENSLLIGGKITGNFKNLGEMRDIHFVGHSLQDGKLSGNIVSKGEFNNVQLAPNAHILGESSETPAILSGNIRGDSQFPAYLENVKVAAKTQISGVKFGKGTVIDPQAVIELPSLTQSHQVDTQGDISETATKFSGGLSVEDTVNFVHELTISDLKPVKLRANIIPALEHIGQRAQLLLVAGVTKLDKYGECEGGNEISYYLLLHSSKQQRRLDLYQEPKVWIPQLVDIQEENELLTEPATVLKDDNLLENKVISGTGCYYFFIGYRLARDNTIVFDTTPLLLKLTL